MTGTPLVLWQNEAGFQLQGDHFSDKWWLLDETGLVLCRGDGHGERWKSVCRLLGLPDQHISKPQNLDDLVMKSATPEEIDAMMDALDSYGNETTDPTLEKPRE